MKSIGFLNLPEWQGKLQKFLTCLGQKELLRAPVNGVESVDNPWVALDPEEFFSAVETGIHFPNSAKVNHFTTNVVTADPELAAKRLSDGFYANTGFKGAIGGTFPILSLFQTGFAISKPTKIIVQNDAVTSYILSRMEKKGKTLLEATHEAQWDDIAPSNPNPHLHGIVTRNRLALQIAEVFGVFSCPENIFTAGISTLELEDIKYAQELNFRIRLLGIAEMVDGNLSVTVEPCVMPDKYFLAQARGGSEIVYLQDETGASHVYACPGTSPEIVVRGILADLYGCFSDKELKIINEINEPNSKYYIRFNLIKLADSIAQLTKILAENGIEISQLNQPSKVLSESDKEESGADIIIVTSEISRKQLTHALEKIEKDVRLVSIKSWFKFIS